MSIEGLDKAPERVELLEQKTPEGDTKLFLEGPAEYLCAALAAALLAVPEWKKFFGEYIDPYKRMDYPLRGLPALRLYNNTYAKESESWWIDGDIVMDLIFPLSIRRKELDQLPGTVASALLQQFRRPSFFRAVAEKVPGLNELGKRFLVDKSLAFELGENEEVPLTQVTVNFRLDLRAWDLYLESEGRTKDEPFEVTLGDLRDILNEITATTLEV
jgi:hypothetical protein